MDSIVSDISVSENESAVKRDCLLESTKEGELLKDVGRMVRHFLNTNSSIKDENVLTAARNLLVAANSLRDAEARTATTAVVAHPPPMIESNALRSISAESIPNVKSKLIEGRPPRMDSSARSKLPPLSKVTPSPLLTSRSKGGSSSFFDESSTKRAAGGGGGLDIDLDDSETAAFHNGSTVQSYSQSNRLTGMIHHHSSSSSSVKDRVA